LTIAGNINQSGSAVVGTVHVAGSTCFDHLTSIGLSGTLSGGNISLTSTSVDGQVTTVKGAITDRAFTGTYNTNGGCAGGSYGNVSGIRMPYIANQLSGTFTTFGQGTFDVVGDIAQNRDASSDGSFGSPERLVSTRPASTRGPSGRERLPQAVSSWAVLLPLKLRLTTGPSFCWGP
jgi:hypothetical protein